MRPQFRASFQIAQLLDEVQSLLLQHDSQAYNRPNLPVGGPLEVSDQDNAMTTSSEDLNSMPPAHRRTTAQPVESAASAHVPAGRLTGSARAQRLAEIQAAIADGSYDSEERLEQALDRFLQVDG